MAVQELTDNDIEHFLQRGYVVVDSCFPPEVVQAWAERAFARLACLLQDSPMRHLDRIHMPSMLEVKIANFAPRLWGAVCDIVGGGDRIQDALMWDSFIINIRDRSDRAWKEPSPTVPGWHKDGDHFRHFLDSPEQGLQVLSVWTDILSRGGGTFVACDSVGIVARFLAEHPEGVLPHEFDFGQLILQCHKFVEVTARAGQAILLHPFTLHSPSQNHLGLPRIITNTPIRLREPMDFGRNNTTDFSPVELAILRGLAIQKYLFRPTANRETFVPERMLRQAMMREKEKALALKDR